MKISQMLKVVSNTTPIISLLKLNQLDLLKHLYKQIYIPLAVYNEIEAGKAKGFYKDLSKLDWIKIIEIQDKQAVKFFLDLDSGEAEAIVLSTELNADLIILDEKLGRFHAKHADLKVTGTIGILLKAKTDGLVKELKPLLNELTEKGVWISEKLKKEILEIVGEN
jgi:predicted nucleic acid-binding protein